jgi:carbamoyl-phosphate synthase small subunit
MKAILALEDGTVFEGISVGAPGRAVGEVVFSTSMTGYQEMLTDPSYRGQILTLTFPLIGNYGENPGDMQSEHPQAEGLVVREICDEPSNWRSRGALRAFLRDHGVVGIAGVDTRSLTRRLRKQGVMMGTITTEENPAEALDRLRHTPGYGDMDFAQEVSTPSAYQWSPGARPGAAQAQIWFEERVRVALIDYGVKRSILQFLYDLGCEVLVLPCTVNARTVLDLAPDALVLSPGPGDPARLDYAVDAVRALIGKLPILGICLGHQLLGLALGGRCYKLKFGHRGANHPVKATTNGGLAPAGVACAERGRRGEGGRTYVTVQNHGYAVDDESLAGTGAVVSHVSLNDGTVEGIVHPDLMITSVQYHPEASAGPQDSRHIYDEFVRSVKARKGS